MNAQLDATQSRKSIQSLVRRILDKKGDRRPFTDQDSLVLSGRFDSIDVLDLIVFIEETFGADFADDGFNQAELDSVDRILERASRRA